MHPRTPKLLEDIRSAGAFIAEVTANLDLARYSHDRLLRNAVERNFEIIGEAMGRLARVDAEVAAAIPGHAQIIAFRNVLAHGYDIVDHALVWNAVERQLPALLEQVGRLLEQAPPP